MTTNPAKKVRFGITRQSAVRFSCLAICVLMGIGLFSSISGWLPVVRAEDADLLEAARERQLELKNDLKFDVDVDSETSPSERRKSKRSRSSKSSDEKSEDGPGIEGRVGHIALPTFGRNQSLTHVELLPYIAVDNHLLFGDARLFMDNQQRLGGNVGFGVRRWSESWNQLYGVSLWYDIDETSGKTFSDVGLSFETYGKAWEARSNVYVPVGTSEQDFDNRLINQRYSGHQILFDRYRDVGVAMKGVDLEVGVPLPTEFAEDRNMRVFGGFYHFLGDSVATINGYKVRLEGSVTDDIATQVQFTDDGTFGTSVTFAVAYEFSGGSAASNSRSRGKSYLMRRFVERNYNVIVSRDTNTLTGLAAINPATGQAYVVQHVNSSAASGSGSAGDPYQSISQAQAAGADVILVRAGSVISSPVTLQSGDLVVGEGANFTLATTNFGDVTLPTNSGAGGLPAIQGVSGNGVTLADNSTMVGFVIDSPTGHGIVANGINGARVEQVTVRGTAGDGVFMQNTTGSFQFVDVAIQDTTGTAFHVDGGSADVTISGTISNTAGRSVVVEDTTGGVINFSGTGINDDGGDGVLISNADGNVKFRNLTVANSGTTGVDIQGGSGAYRFLGTTTVSNASGTGINIDGKTGLAQFSTVNVTDSSGNIGVSLTNSTGTTSFAKLNITTDGGTGLYVANGGTITSAAGTISSNAATAVDIDGTIVDMDLTGVSSDGAVNGIRIANTIGEFQIWGTGTPGSGGTIQNATVGVLIENSQAVGLQGIDLIANGTGIQASDSTRLTILQSRVMDSTGTGVDLRNVNNLEVWFSEFVDNANGAIHADVDTVGTYNYDIARSIISDSSTTPLAFTTSAGGEGSNLVLTVDRNMLTTNADAATAVSVDWDGVAIGTIVSNEFTGEGNSNIGLQVTANSTSALTQFTAYNNGFQFNGNDSTAMSFVTAGPSQLDLDSNIITFDGANGVGMDFDLAQSADVNILSNLITDNVSAGTGIHFTSIDGPSIVAINDNIINLLSTNGSVDYGMVFSTVNGTIELDGTLNNAVNGASVPFQIPVGTSTGQIYINWAPLP